MTAIPASIRHRNPGAAYPGPSSKPFGGTTHAIIGGGHQIAIFPTMVDGASSMMHLLWRVYTGLTFSAAIAKWSGGNNINSYLRVIEARTRWTRHDYITLQLIEDQDMAIELCKAMAFHEAGIEYPMTDAQWREAHEQFMTVIGGGSVPIDRNNSKPAEDLLAWFESNIGQARIPGPANNDFITDAWKAIGSPLTSDEYAHCAGVLGYGLKENGYAYIAGEAGQLAKNYRNYGHALDEPEVGAIVVEWRVSPNSWQGHVSVIKSWTATTVTCIGANQRDPKTGKTGVVCERTIPRMGQPGSQIIAYRRPVPAVRAVTEIVREDSVGQKVVGITGVLTALWYGAKDWLSYIVDSIGAVIGFAPEIAAGVTSNVVAGQQITEAAGMPWPAKLGLLIVLVTLSIGLYRTWQRLKANDGSLTTPPYETDIEPEVGAVDMFDAPLPPERPRRSAARKTDSARKVAQKADPDKKPARKPRTRRKAA